MADPVIEFFDIPNNQSPPCGWSPNTFKTEIVLNYKKIPYKHTFLEYPDIAPTLKSLGARPYSDDIRPYTCPAIAHPGTLPHPIMESFAIACHLDKHFPENPVFPTAGSKALAAAIQRIINISVFPLVAPVMLPKTPKFLPERSAKYFQETRAEAFGMSLAEYEKKADVPALLKALGQIGGILNQEEGPFFMGTTPSYADFIVVGFLAWFRPHGKIFDQVLDAGDDGAFRKLWEASKQWL